MEWNEEAVKSDLIANFGEDYAEEIEDSLHLDKGRYANWGEAGSVTVDGIEYNIIRDEGEAERIATELVTQDLDQEPSIFNQDWLQSFVYITDTDKRMMASEEEDTIREMVEEQAEEDEFESDEEKNAWIEEKVEEHLKEFEKDLDDPINYFVEEQGMYSVEDLMKQSWINIDINAAAEDAINVDGWSHFISHYDGNYETTNGGLVYFRED